MTEELAFESVTVRRAPGFATDGFEVEDFSSDVNVIHGPNGAGKSTLARTMQSLLWPERAPDNTSAVGQFSTDEQWRVELAQQQASYQKDGVEANGPNLPSSEQAPRYNLALHDLLQHETRDTSFAKQIERESRGGYDLEAAYEQLGFDDSAKTKRITEYKDVESYTKKWRETRNELEELKQEEARLPQLKSKLEEAKAAEDRVDLLDQAIQYQQAEAALSDAKAELKEFPEVLEEVTGEEVDKVSNYAEDIEQAREDKKDAEAKLEEAKRKLEEADLPDEGLSEGFISKLQDQRDELTRLEQRLDQFEDELEKAEKRRETALNELPLDATHEDLKGLDPAAWSDIVDFAEEAESIDADRKAHRAYESWLSNGSGSLPEESVLQQGTSALEDWLAASSGIKTGNGQPTLRIGVASALLLGVASIALGFFVNPLLYTTVLIPGLLLLYAYVASQSDAEGTDSQATHRDRFKNLDLEPPASWTPDEVHSRLNELYGQLAEVKLDEKRIEHRKAVSPELGELEARESELEDRRQELIKEYGVAPDTTDIELVAITKGVIRWQEANEEVEGRKAQIDEVESKIKEKQERLEDELSPYGYGSVDDHSIATEYIRELDSRWTTHREATETRDRAKETIASADKTIDELTSERDAVYKDLNLAPGAQRELESLCEQVDQFAEVKETVNGQKRVRDNELEELKDHPEFDSELLEATVGELRERKAEAEEIAAEREDLQKTVTEIKFNVENAKGEYDLEEAIEDRQRALDALEDRLFDDAAKMVGDVLVNHLRDTSGSGGRPEVFSRARDLLLKITRGRYKLDLNDGVFRAYDTVKERGFGLDELSSGTKLQVLLAVRIAFVEQQESGVKLPLFLDETLANSDDNRAEVIIDSVIELARDGRQVCYFTAQGDEVAKWRRALKTANEVEYREIDLAATQTNTAAVSIPDTDEFAVDSRELPDPATHDHESYGETLDIPDFLPRQGAGAAHVWHVVDDTEVLHRLVRLGIERWGQLESLLEQGNESVLTEDDETLRRIRLNGAAVNEFVRSWQIGRGDPVDRQALEDTGAVSDRFIDDVSELARDVNGDAESILAKLRESAVSGFRSNKIDELEEYFKNNGYIQQRDPLEPATIRSRIINRLTEEEMTRDEAFERAEQLLQRLSNPPR